MEKLNNNGYGGGTQMGMSIFTVRPLLYAVSFHCLWVPYLQIYLLAKIYL